MRFVITTKPQLTDDQRIQVLKTLTTLWMSPSLGYAVATLDARADASRLEGFRPEMVETVCRKLTGYGVRVDVSTLTFS